MAWAQLKALESLVSVAVEVDAAINGRIIGRGGNGLRALQVRLHFSVRRHDDLVLINKQRAVRTRLHCCGGIHNDGETNGKCANRQNRQLLTTGEGSIGRRVGGGEMHL